MKEISHDWLSEWRRDVLPSVHLCWTDPVTFAVVFIGAEDAITPDFLRENAVQLVLTTNEGHSKIDQAVKDAGLESGHLIHTFLDFHRKPQTPEQLRAGADAVEQMIRAIESGKRIVVHCRAGINRSTGVLYTALRIMGRVPSTYDAYCLIRKNRPEAGLHQSLVKWLRQEHKRNYPGRYTQPEAHA